MRDDLRPYQFLRRMVKQARQRAMQGDGQLVLKEFIDGILIELARGREFSKQGVNTYDVGGNLLKMKISY